MGVEVIESGILMVKPGLDDDSGRDGLADWGSSGSSSDSEDSSSDDSDEVSDDVEAVLVALELDTTGT
jgi:hypothetical protein